MPKCMIKNIYDDQTFTFYLPADANDALVFAKAVCDGKVQVWSELSSTGSDAPAPHKEVTAQLRQLNNGVTERSAYLTFRAAMNATETAIRGVFAGQTVNGVRADEITLRVREIA